MQKRLREVRLIAEAMEPGATVVLELGCGTGRNLALLADRTREGGLMVGIEPDPERAREAAAQGYPVVRDSIEALAKAPDGIFDHALCCQVLGHTTIDDTKRAIVELVRTTREGGTVQLMVPVRNMRFGRRDYLHIASVQGHADRVLGEDEYDERAAAGGAPEHDELAVRAFAMRMSGSKAEELPWRAGHAPPAIEALVGDEARIERVAVYSVHRWEGMRRNAATRWCSSGRRRGEDHPHDYHSSPRLRDRPRRAVMCLRRNCVPRARG